DPTASVLGFDLCDGGQQPHEHPAHRRRRVERLGRADEFDARCLAALEQLREAEDRSHDSVQTVKDDDVRLLEAAEHRVESGPAFLPAGDVDVLEAFDELPAAICAVRLDGRALLLDRRRGIAVVREPEVAEGAGHALSLAAASCARASSAKESRLTMWRKSLAIRRASSVRSSSELLTKVSIDGTPPRLTLAVSPTACQKSPYPAASNICAIV